MLSEFKKLALPLLASYSLDNLQRLYLEKKETVTGWNA